VNANCLKDNTQLESLDPKPSDLTVARLMFARTEDRTCVRSNVLG